MPGFVLTRPSLQCELRPGSEDGRAGRQAGECGMRERHAETAVSPIVFPDPPLGGPASIPLPVAGLPLERSPCTPAARGPLTFAVLVVVHDVTQGLHEDVLPGPLKGALLLPVLHAFHLAPRGQGLGPPAFAIIVEEGLVVEVGDGLEVGGALTGLGQPRVEEAQRVIPCGKGKDFEDWRPCRRARCRAAGGRAGRALGLPLLSSIRLLSAADRRGLPREKGQPLSWG